MKKGYKKLLILEIIIIILSFLNNFVSNILGDYKIIILIGLFGAIYLLFGYEKDRHHLSKSVMVEILIFIMTYFILYYLFGVIISFMRTTNYLTFDGIFRVIIPLIVTIVLREILRYQFMCKAEGSRLLIIMTCITFISFDLIGRWSFRSFVSPYTTFLFIALRLLPIISKNILGCYITSKVGYKPGIVYFLIMELYGYFIPIVPNPSEYIYSVIEFVVPFVLMFKLNRFLNKYRDEDVVREHHKKRIGALALPAVIVLFLVYITSGYFRYYAIVIASGSMSPNLYKGDVVIVEKKEKSKELEKNDIIAYKYNGLIVVHRIARVVDTGGEKIYFTKGDANRAMDNYKITSDMIIGVVDVKVPYIGYPTVWLKRL